MSKRQGYRGYVTHRAFGGYRISVAMQHVILREYLARNGLMFKLSVNEFDFPNCYMQLDGLLRQMSTIEGIVMCSLFMLPSDAVKRAEIYERCLSESVQLHFVIEALAIRDPEGIEAIEGIFRFEETLNQCPKAIPKELLPELDGLDNFMSEPPR